jgi:hypothetical protein
MSTHRPGPLTFLPQPPPPPFSRLHYDFTLPPPFLKINLRI